MIIAATADALVTQTTIALLALTTHTAMSSEPAYAEITTQDQGVKIMLSLVNVNQSAAISDVVDLELKTAFSA